MRSLLMLFYLHLLLILTIYVSTSVSVTIRTRLGAVTGTERKSRDGNVYYAFTRIPYAKPPIGQLRLKNPVEAECWEGTLDGTQELERCLQLVVHSRTSDGKTTGEEDCLYLNVCTPPLLDSREKLPVLVYIHGGGFRRGSVGSKSGPNYFMDENVVLVNFHYRLGILGFLSMENGMIPGNFGLKDQAMAIKWVHKHIDSFGGDPNRITIFGGSSAGVSTHYHMMSPLTKGLIKGAISQSGVVNKFLGYSPPGEASYYANAVARVVGCSDKQDVELLTCLQQVSYKKLFSAQSSLVDPVVNITLTFQPVQEIKADGAFLPFDPIVEETTLPWITGINAFDGLLPFGTPLIQDSTVTQKFIENPGELLPRLLYLRNKSGVDEIKAKYFPPPLSIQSAREAVLKVFEDLLFISAMNMAMKRHKGPLFQYYYNHRGANSYMDKFGVQSYGAAHSDEMILLFNMTERFPKYKAEDEEISRFLVKMWANFAKKQNPSTEGEFIWPDYRQSAEYLHIKRPPTVERNLKLDTTKWWARLNL